MEGDALWWGLADPATPVTELPAHLPGCSTSASTRLASTSHPPIPRRNLGLIDIADPELAGPVARAVNSWLADLFRPYADRLTVRAIIPMVTPDVAEAEIRLRRE